MFSRAVSKPYKELTGAKVIVRAYRAGQDEKGRAHILYLNFINFPFVLHHPGDHKGIHQIIQMAGVNLVDSRACTERHCGFFEALIAPARQEQVEIAQAIGGRLDISAPTAELGLAPVAFGSLDEIQGKGYTIETFDFILKDLKKTHNIQFIYSGKNHPNIINFLVGRHGGFKKVGDREIYARML